MTELRFSCTECGECCRRPGVVVLASDEMEAIAAHLGVSVQTLIEECAIEPRGDVWWIRLRNNPCPLLVEDRCSVHAVKPRQCRAYPFWPEIVGSFESWKEEAAICPGIGRGQEWSDAQVQQMLELLDG